MTAASAARPRARPAIDWRRAAELLAGGASLAETAGQVGCSKDHLARKRRRDEMFQRWIAESRTPRPRTGNRMADLRTALLEAIEAEVKDGNVRVILWLADRLKLVTPVDERTPEAELQELLGSLGPEELREFETLQEPA
jgi:hypothetical protein